MRIATTANRFGTGALVALVLALLVRSIALPVWSSAGTPGTWQTEAAHQSVSLCACESSAMAHDCLTVAGDIGCCERSLTPHCDMGVCTSVVACLSSAQALRVDGGAAPRHATEHCFVTAVAAPLSTSKVPLIVSGYCCYRA